MGIIVMLGGFLFQVVDYNNDSQGGFLFMMVGTGNNYKVRDCVNGEKKTKEGGCPNAFRPF